MNNSEAVLYVFTRAPVAGKVKTRLLPRLSAEEACELYQNLLFRTLETACAAGFAQVRLCCTPTLRHPFLQLCADTYDVELCLQAGADLGEKMNTALLDGLRDFSQALVIGCDCPWLTVQDLESARLALATDTDIVLGPAVDGGYYLIGMNSANDYLFRQMNWGGSDVLAKTRQTLVAAGKRWQELDEHPDLDRPEDLDAYEKLLLV